MERGSRNCFTIEVPNRRSDALLPLISNQVFPGTQIIIILYQILSRPFFVSANTMCERLFICFKSNKDHSLRLIFCESAVSHRNLRRNVSLQPTSARTKRCTNSFIKFDCSYMLMSFASWTPVSFSYLTFLYLLPSFFISLVVLKLYFYE